MVVEKSVPMKPWIKIERIPGVLVSAYEKASRLVIDSYYRRIAEEIVAPWVRGPDICRSKSLKGHPVFISSVLI
jgi:hypothetical protein